jgi:uncharacterized integral membrane protein
LTKAELFLERRTMRMQTQQQQQASVKKGMSIKTIVLVLVVIIFTVFAVQNWSPVDVWPLGKKTLTLVIGISFVLGAMIGWLGHSILFGKRSLSVTRGSAD